MPIQVNAPLDDCTFSDAGLIGFAEGRQKIKLLVRDYQLVISETAGLVAYWKMDGDFTDSKGSNDGTAFGAVAADGVAKYGTFSGNFPGGGNDYLNVGSDASLDNIFAGGGSIELWVYPTTWAGEAANGRVASKSNVGATGWNIHLSSDGGLILAVDFDGTAGNWRIPECSILLNTWHHIVITYNSSSVANDPVIYLNAVSQSITEVVTPVGTVVSDAGRDMFIGARNNGGVPDREFAGRIDEFAAYNVELSSSTVEQHLNAYSSDGETATLQQLDLGASHEITWANLLMPINTLDEAGPVKASYKLDNGAWSAYQILILVSNKEYRFDEAGTFNAQYIDIEYQLNSDGTQESAAGRPRIKNFTPGVVCDYPAITDVRLNVDYDSGVLTGTAAIPGAGDVRLGVPTDATIGTLAVVPASDTRLGVPTDATVGDYVPADEDRHALGDSYGSLGTEFTGTKALTPFELPVEVILEDSEILILEGCE